ncbi:MAG: hypothetical protein RLZZ148_336, partial [Cyanobacteriota bacterium]
MELSSLNTLERLCYTATGFLEVAVNSP